MTNQMRSAIYGVISLFILVLGVSWVLDLW